VLIARREGGYQSFNRGRAGDSPGKIDFSKMTLGQVMAQQARPRGDPNRLFAVGKYQIIPATMKEAVEALGLQPQEPFTPKLQEHLFRNYLIGRKRPQVRRYVAGTGSTGDLQAAQLALAKEFASVASPVTGRSFYAGSGGNAAATSAADVAKALEEERQLYRTLVATGKTPDEAWSTLSGMPAPAGVGLQPPQGPALARRQSGLNIAAAVAHLRANAQPHSTGMCARYVRLALKAGGVEIQPFPPIARIYGPPLTQCGFVNINPFLEYTPQAGDVVVIQNYPGGKNAGHIAMYSGSEWISDFKQRDIWAGPGYRAKKPRIDIFRP
jgi:hypothetical protein